MIALTHDVEQTVAVGEALNFNTKVYKSHDGCECNTEFATNFIKIRKRGKYDVHFHANVSGADTTALSLSLALGGVVIPYSTMVSTPTIDGLNNVSITVPIKVCCGDFDRITVVNTGTTAITIAEYPFIEVHRVEEVI